MKLLTVVVLVFLILGGYMIYQGYNYNLSNSDDRSSFVKKTSKWMWDVGKATARVVGVAVKEGAKEDWLPDVPKDGPDEDKSNSNETVSGVLPG